MVTLGVLLTLLMVTCFLFSTFMLIRKIFQGKILGIIWFAIGVYTSYYMIGEFTIATIEMAKG